MNSKFIKLCKKISENSDHEQHKMAALIIRKNKVFSMGFNTNKTHTKSPFKYKTQHAEFSAIKMCSPEQLYNSTILVYRATKDGTLANAKPCESCLKLIIQSGIKKIIYTNDNSMHTIYL